MRPSASESSPAEAALREGAAFILGRSLSDEELQRFRTYLALLGQWQPTHRLAGSADPLWAARNLILDSLLFTRVLPADSRRLLDLGSGAGVPGVPLKIVRPDLDVTLVESRRRRASFLAAVVRDLRLPGLSVLNERLDVVPGSLRGRFDAVVARCASEPDTVMDIGLQLVGSAGLVVVAGPPSRHALGRGEWIEVPGASRGTSRLFAVVRRT